MTDSQLIATADEKQVLLAWCALNCHVWPRLFPQPEQPEPGPVWGTHSRARRLMRAIERKYGIDNCLAFWKSQRAYRMTREELRRM